MNLASFIQAAQHEGELAVEGGSNARLLAPTDTLDNLTGAAAGFAGSILNASDAFAIWTDVFAGSRRSCRRIIARPIVIGIWHGSVAPALTKYTPMSALSYLLSLL